MDYEEKKPMDSENPNSANKLIEMIEERVQQAKNDPAFREQYLSYQMKIRDAEIRGEQRILKKIVTKMLQRGMSMDDISALTDITLESLQMFQSNLNPSSEAQK